MSKFRALQYDALFFSPHLDDAVLSCGGLLARLQAQRKKTLVVTIFTQGQELVSKSKDLQLFLKQSAAANSEELFRKRRQEDAAAGHFLNFDYVHLGYIDALWRTHESAPFYPTFKQIFSGKISVHDDQLEKKIKNSCQKIIQSSKKTATIYAPLAIGQHTDHLLTFNIMRKIHRQLNKKFIYWEDVPYRNQVGAREKRFSAFKTLPSCSFLQYSPAEAAKKIKACSLYKSQITWLKEAGLGTLDYYREGFFKL